MSIPQEIIEEVRSRTSLSEIVGESVSLRRAGRSWIGLCPFHSEKTPSFHVHEEEGYFHCFGCGEKGTVYNFLMKSRGYSFPEAVRYLAGRAGITVPEARRSEQRASARMRGLLEAAQLAAETYSWVLHNDKAGQRGRDYLHDRGIGEPVQKTFRLGFAPESWEYLAKAIETRLRTVKSPFAGRTEELAPHLSALGLIKQRSGANGYYDVFRGRVVFPISRSDGAAVAFGARLISKSDQGPKYLNTSESMLYAKRRTFYGLSQALPQIRKTRHVYLVEGYLDVLTMHQAGLNAALAACGTAVTADHARIIGRFAQQLTLVFDGDAAGRKAAAACFTVFLNTGIDPRVLLLPEGEDPDSIIQKEGAAGFQALMETKCVSAASVYLGWLHADCAGAGSAASAAASGRVAERYAQVLSGVRNPVEREILIKEGAEHLGVSESSLSALVRRPQKVKAPALGGPETAYGGIPEYEQVPIEEVPCDDYEFPPPQAAPAAAGKKMEARAGEAGDYIRQLIIALLCEPQLAPFILEMPSLTSPGGTVEAFPAGVQAFIRDLAGGDYLGLSQLALRVPGKEAESEEAQHLKNLLAGRGLAGEELFQEAVRQLRMGGEKPAAVVAKAGKEMARRLLHDEMRRIRAAESQAADERSREELAQEKLANKRRLFKLRDQS